MLNLLHRFSKQLRVRAAMPSFFLLRGRRMRAARCRRHMLNGRRLPIAPTFPSEAQAAVRMPQLEGRES